MYKEDLREQILQAITEFFQAEQGNRLTVFSVNGLSMHLDKLFQENKVEEKE